MGHGHGHDHRPSRQGHSHRGHSADADRRLLSGALLLIAGFMAAEVVLGVLAGSLALITDAAHMLTDAAAIVLALVAIRLAARPARGHYTFGLHRAEILAAQLNGLTLVLLSAWFGYEGVRRLMDPPEVAGGLVLVTALAGIAVNVVATWLVGRANRRSLNVEGAFQHLLTDLFAFIATAAAGLVVAVAGFDRADAIAALVVAALMVKAGVSLVRAANRILLEAAPGELDPDHLGRQLAELPDVVEVHDLHVWQITSGSPTLSAHVLVRIGADCHAVRATVEQLLREAHHIDHTTLQIDHVGETDDGAHCPGAHGQVHRPATSADSGTGLPAAVSPNRAHPCSVATYDGLNSGEHARNGQSPAPEPRVE